MVGAMPPNRFNDGITKIAQKARNGDSASNIITSLEELSILNCDTFLRSPMEGNRLGLKAMGIFLLNLGRLRGDACLADIMLGYECVYSMSKF